MARRALRAACYGAGVMPVQKVSSSQAVALCAADAVYLDVRSVPEYEAGHAPGAYNIPLLHAGPGGMQDRKSVV